jgi:hypothetical protein
VNTTAARYQNLSINQAKLSGQCGRLKCCLNYELDTYLDALQHFPDHADTLEITRGRAFLVKKDIFKNLMWYTLPDSTKQYPLTIKRVKEIMAMNREGRRPDDLEAVEVVSSKPREVEPEFVDVVGQISLRSLEKTSRRQRDRDRSRGQQDRGKSQPPQGDQQQVGQNRPPQQQKRPPQQQQQPGQKPPQQQNQQKQPQNQGQGNNQRRNKPPRGPRPPKQEGGQ